MIYLAIPYTWCPEESFRIANEVTKELLLEGEVVFSPVSQMHILSKSMDKAVVNSHDFWMSKEIPILKMCDKLVIVEIGNSGLELIRTSRGCQQEMKEANENNIKLSFYKFKRLKTKNVVSESKSSPLDKQVGGEHYKKQGIQPIEYIQANNLNFCEGNIVKYVTRYKDKNGLQDLEKTQHYLEFLIEDYKKKTNK